MAAHQVLSFTVLSRALKLIYVIILAAFVNSACNGLGLVRHQSTSSTDAISARNPPPSVFGAESGSRRTSGRASKSSLPSSSPIPIVEAEPILNRREKAEIANHPPDSFHSLKGYIEYPIYKALVEKPFQFTTMSAVQQEVLGLLPELTDSTARGAAPREKEESEGQDAEKVASLKRGERSFATDLLVKAKTGTGKTIAFLAPALEARVQDLQQEARDFKSTNPQYVDSLPIPTQ